MKCDDCVKDVSGALYKLEGIKKVEANLKEQLVSIEGTGKSSRIGIAFQLGRYRGWIGPDADNQDLQLLRRR